MADIHFHVYCTGEFSFHNNMHRPPQFHGFIYERNELCCNIIRTQQFISPIKNFRENVLFNGLLMFQINESWFFCQKNYSNIYIYIYIQLNVRKETKVVGTQSFTKKRRNQLYSHQFRPSTINHYRNSTIN